jgi:transcriptional regulator with XRE-family HTH domain
VSFTDKLRRLVEDRRLTVISRRAGMRPGAISDYLDKGNIPRADNALRLARALGVGLAWLVDPETDFPAVPATERQPAKVA